MENQVAEKTTMFEPLDFQNTESDSQFSQFSQQELTAVKTPSTPPTISSNTNEETQRTETVPPPTEHDNCDSQAVAEPQLLVDREGNRVIRIRVLCGCGKSIVLKCNYPEQAESKPTSNAPTATEDKPFPNTTPTRNPAVAATA